MGRDDLADLVGFAAVADARSFTRAATTLGMSPSALSHALKSLETRLGVRLLARTTRSVAPTEAGDRLLATLRPALADISAGLTELAEQRDRPAGTVRITAPQHAAMTILWPALPGFLAKHPEVRVEISVDASLTDIVASRFDAGLRFGDRVAGDMVAVRVGPEVRVAVVGSPDYLARHPAPATPRELVAHRCINYRLPTSDGFYLWEFERSGRPMQVRVDGPLVLNDADLLREAALAGLGLVYLIEDYVAEPIAAGRLIRVLADWCIPFPGYYLYHPSRKQVPPALAALIAALLARRDRRG